MPNTYTYSDGHPHPLDQVQSTSMYYEEYKDVAGKECKHVPMEHWLD